MSGDRGSTTVEWALSLPVVVMLAMAAVSGMVAVAAKLGCISVTRDTALALARGGDPSIPDGAVVSRDGETVTVAVHRPVTGCSATAVLEP
ncbi:TadE/TadG family type IV pilus assembly protein [Allorhizocola rhizosphaerae]|uniref:TadE/TadG family type IV pilus assembly protein n=1 Tax=Allorhizocola rhizosphaerae TaxID=1872709 RepID=UPI000E3D9863|nr:TadE family protein [Allorhizocola rhizosphaerae]